MFPIFGMQFFFALLESGVKAVFIEENKRLQLDILEEASNERNQLDSHLLWKTMEHLNV